MADGTFWGIMGPTCSTTEQGSPDIHGIQRLVLQELVQFIIIINVIITIVF